MADINIKREGPTGPRSPPSRGRGRQTPGPHWPLPTTMHMAVVGTRGLHIRERARLRRWSTRSTRSCARFATRWWGRAVFTNELGYDASPTRSTRSCARFATRWWGACGLHERARLRHSADSFNSFKPFMRALRHAVVGGVRSSRTSLATTLRRLVQLAHSFMRALRHTVVGACSLHERARLRHFADSFNSLTRSCAHFATPWGRAVFMNELGYDTSPTRSTRSHTCLTANPARRGHAVFDPSQSTPALPPRDASAGIERLTQPRSPAQLYSSISLHFSQSTSTWYISPFLSIDVNLDTIGVFDYTMLSPWGRATHATAIPMR